MKLGLGDIGLILVAGALLYIIAKHSNTAFIGATCAGLTGATLRACQKKTSTLLKKPKPVVVPKKVPFSTKPKVGITPAPKGITPAKKSISTPTSRAKSTGGGVGGPTTKAFNCMKKRWQWRCFRTATGSRCVCNNPKITPTIPSMTKEETDYLYRQGRPITTAEKQCYDLNGIWDSSTGRCIKSFAITPTNPRNVANKKCIEAAEEAIEPQRERAIKNLMVEMGFRTEQQLSANRGRNSGYRKGLIDKKYDDMKIQLRADCLKKQGYPARVDPDLRQPFLHAI